MSQVMTNELSAILTWSPLANGLLATVSVNTPVVATAETPFGGIKQTGYGREGGSVGIKDYLNIKYTHLGLSG